MRTLLMGGQACVFCGAAEFSRDLDLLIVADPVSLTLLSQALSRLQAAQIGVPKLHADVLDRGHAVHFRCQAGDVTGLWIDVMSRLRGVEDFEQLWLRRTTIVADGIEVDMLALPDLVREKKTQRDKDWPMIRRLVEQAYFSATLPLDEVHLDFLLRELRTPDLLTILVRRYPESAERLSVVRPAIRQALDGNLTALSAALDEEESAERESDRIYWEPLKRELEQFRRTRDKLQSD